MAVFTTSIQVRFGHVDPAGIAYYPRIYDYVHDGATNIRLTQLDKSLDVKKSQTAFAPDKPKPGEEPLQILRERPIFLQQGGGMDALIQSITIQVPMMR